MGGFSCRRICGRKTRAAATTTRAGAGATIFALGWTELTQRGPICPLGASQPPTARGDPPRTEIETRRSFCPREPVDRMEVPTLVLVPVRRPATPGSEPVAPPEARPRSLEE